MKDSYSHITVILDRSGSMASIRDDVVGGLNTLLEKQKGVPGECTVTLVQFDTENAYEILRDFVPIATIEPLGAEYKPRGGTPLHDAVGKGIVLTGERLAAMQEADRPAKVIFVVVTDGQENSSREYTAAMVAGMVKEQEEKYGWDFVYLGANQDAVLEASKFGVNQYNAASYAATNVRSAVAMAGSKMASYRSSSLKSDLAYSTDERAELMEGK